MTAEGSIWNYNSEMFEKAIFFFDSGAQKTVIQEEFAYKLGLPKLKSETCIMSGIGGNVETFESNIVHLKVGTAYGKDMNILIQTKPVLTNGFPAVKLSAKDQQFLQERHLLVCNPHIRGEHHVPHVIVGLDYYYSFVFDNEETVVTPSGLRMAKTIFGPTLYGRGSTDVDQQRGAAKIDVTYGLTAVTEHELLNRTFELDGMGISADEITNHDFVAYFKDYSRQISFSNGYATAPFPLKPNIADLADNYSTALRRLMSLHNQLENNPTQKEWYCKILKQYETDDIIERVSGEIPNSVGLYYMPHSGVWRENKPRPLRIVFDASSKRKGHLSLNDVMHKGQSLVNKIHDILIASRTSKIIMICDIEAAFTQIRLQDTHKDLCRFLWLQNPDQPPGAPWMGGAWERLVGTVKRAFAKSIGRRKLSHSELYTAVTQIEAIVNTRPLTAVSDNVDEVPIRPIDFLQSSLKYSFVPTDDEEIFDPTFEPDHPNCFSGQTSTTSL